MIVSMIAILLYKVVCLWVFPSLYLHQSFIFQFTWTHRIHTNILGNRANSLYLVKENDSYLPWFPLPEWQLASCCRWSWHHRTLPSMLPVCLPANSVSSASPSAPSLQRAWNMKLISCYLKIERGSRIRRKDEQESLWNVLIPGW